MSMRQWYLQVKNESDCSPEWSSGTQRQMSEADFILRSVGSAHPFRWPGRQHLWFVHIHVQSTFITGDVDNRGPILSMFYCVYCKIASWPIKVLMSTFVLFIQALKSIKEQLNKFNNKLKMSKAPRHFKMKVFQIPLPVQHFLTAMGLLHLAGKKKNSVFPHT